MSQPLRIVVADDDEDILHYYARMIPHLGHELLGNVNDGLALVDSCLSSVPDIAVSDVQMRKLDGISAMERVQREVNIPFIFVSADDEAKHCQRLNRANVLAYLQKPIRRKQLSAALEAAYSADSPVRRLLPGNHTNLQHE
jgi:CheY-like chemotaxis protein